MKIRAANTAKNWIKVEGKAAYLLHKGVKIRLSNGLEVTIMRQMCCGKWRAIPNGKWPADLVGMKFEIV